MKFNVTSWLPLVVSRVLEYLVVYCCVLIVIKVIRSQLNRFNNYKSMFACFSILFAWGLILNYIRLRDYSKFMV